MPGYKYPCHCQVPCSHTLDSKSLLPMMTSSVPRPDSSVACCDVVILSMISLSRSCNTTSLCRRDKQSLSILQSCLPTVMLHVVSCLQEFVEELELPRGVLAVLASPGSADCTTLLIAVRAATLPTRSATTTCRSSTILLGQR